MLMDGRLGVEVLGERNAMEGSPQNPLGQGSHKACQIKLHLGTQHL